MKRKGRFDAILIETTGLADPAPVAQTFFVDDEVRSRTKLDSIVTVVDAKNFLQRLEDSHEAAEQVAFADIVLLNKIDLVSADEAARVEGRIRAINPMARLHKTDHCEMPVTELLDRGAFDLNRILEIEPNFLGEDDHEHDDAITSVSLRANRALDPKKFNDWISELLRERGIDILRCKGILDLKNNPNRFVFQGVHMLMEGDAGKPWQENESRESKFVLIGRNLDESELRTGFETCLTA
jgi:G3E family GTPase